MKAVEAELLKFLQGTRQFIIPIYQRQYSWTLEQCAQLWEDIVRAAENDKIPAHFIGSVVYIGRGIYQATTVPELLVIDGQQRLTTISLLLAALRKEINTFTTDSEVTRKKIENYYLFNSEESGEKRYKLILTDHDKETFISLLEDRELPKESSYRLIENYKFFEDSIKKRNIEPIKLYNGISKIIIVDVSLDRTYDNPQLIFESMNSTGLDLTQADLIRNYVLMGLEPKVQTDLYNNYWYRMEQSFGNAEYSDKFDQFMRDYLTVKSESGAIPNIDEVYSNFKKYFKNSNKNIEDVVSDIYKYSKYFVKLAFNKEIDGEINSIVSDINTLRVDVAYPFLLEVYDDYETKNLIKKDEFIELLKLVESYVFRRSICGVPTNSLNKTFATLSKEINKTKYLESFKAVLITKDNYRRFPTNEEFLNQFVIKDMYNFRNRNYLLRKLENYNRKEIVNVDSYTIEHIMPQNPNLPEEWKVDLGTNWKEVQEMYLHTIGNLTLTGYNSEMSDNPFKEKRDQEGGFRDSPIRLNRSLAALEKWNEEEIKKRAEEIAKLAFEVWTYPSVEKTILDEYKLEKETSTKNIYSIDNYQYLEQDAPMRPLFEELRKRILNIDSSVREEPQKLYIAYKSITNFVDLIPQRKALRLSLNIPFEKINDPEKKCRNVYGLGRWGNGDTEVKLDSQEELDYTLDLIKQAFDNILEVENDN